MKTLFIRRLGRISHAAVAVAVAMVCAGVQPAWADPFTDALMSAYDTNPRLKSERESLKQLDEGVSQALAGWRPSVFGDYSRGRQRNAFATADWSYTDNTTKQLTVDQPIFNGGETLARTSSAKKLVKAGQAQLEAAEQTVLLDAVQAYMNVVQAQSVQELSRSNLDVLREQSKATSDRFDVGEVTRTDVSQSNARVSRAESDFTQSQGEVESTRAVFKRVIGYDPGTLPMPEPAQNMPANPDEAYKIAVENNPNLKASKYRQLSAEEDVGARVAAILPDVSLRGSMRREDGAGVAGNASFDTDQVAVAVSVPFYQSGAEYSRVRAAKNLAAQRRFDLLDTGDAVRESVTRAWEQYQTNKAIIVSNQAAIKAAEVALEGVKQEQQYGARTTLDVLDAEQEYFTARVNLVRAQRNAVVSEYNLLAVMGRLKAKDLALKVNMYNPKEHYRDVKYKLIGF